MSSRVLLPAPLEPTNAVVRFSAMSSESPRSTYSSESGYRKLSSRSTMSPEKRSALRGCSSCTPPTASSSTTFETMSSPARPVRVVARLAEMRFIAGSARRDAAANTPSTVSASAGVPVVNRITEMPMIATTNPISSRYRGASERMPMTRAALARLISPRRNPSMNAFALDVSRASRKPSSPGRRNCQASSPAAASSSPTRYCRRRSSNCTPNTSTPNRMTAKSVTAGDVIASTPVIADEHQCVRDDAHDPEEDARGLARRVVDVPVHLADTTGSVVGVRRERISARQLGRRQRGDPGGAPEQPPPEHDRADALQDEHHRDERRPRRG